MDADVAFVVIQYDVSNSYLSYVNDYHPSISYGSFHQNSTRLIRSAVFGTRSDDATHDHYIFPQNNLHITNIDVQSAEPVDQNTRETIQKCVGSMFFAFTCR